MFKYSITERGRTLIEVLGVIAIGGLLTIGAVKVFKNVKRSQNQIVMTDELRSLNDNIQILFSGRRDFTGLNTAYLIKAGAINSEKTSISDKFFANVANNDVSKYQLEFVNVSYDVCTYFSMVKLDFVSEIRINNYVSGNPDYCNKNKENSIKFYFNAK